MNLPTALHVVVDYVARAAVLSGEQLLIVLGPLVLLAGVIQIVSGYVRTRSAAVVGTRAYVYLTAPGVVIHELGHAVFCVLFGHRIVSMSLFRPRADGTLGHVEHASNPRNVYQRIGNFFIGTGPIWLGSVLVLLLCRVLMPAGAGGGEPLPADWAGSWQGATAAVGAVAEAAWRAFGVFLRPSLWADWRFWVFAYLVFCIGSHVTLSRSDVAGARSGFVSLVAAVVAVNLATLWVGEGLLLRGCEWLVGVSVTLYAALLLVIGLNVVLALVLFALGRVRG